MSPGDEFPGGCRWVELSKFADECGALTPVESARDVPFEISRVFFFYDVPVGEARGAHAHHRLEQVLIAISGSYRVSLDDGTRSTTVICDRPWRGLYLPPMVWASQTDFTGATVGISLASRPFSEDDYIRDRAEFLALVRQ